MAIDWKNIISPEARARVEEVGREVERLHALPDRFLARALLDMARRGREDHPERLGVPREAGYGNLLIWSVIPALAQRLGEKGLTETEKSCAREVPREPAELRRFIGNCLLNSDLQTLGIEAGSRALDVLGHSIVNGNPITSALDRIAPPAPESDDWVARHMREVSRSRFGDERFDSWTPEFQDWKAVREAAAAAKAGDSPAP
jgi:hypothetical protein